MDLKETDMPRETALITRDDLMPLSEYLKIRKEKKEENVLRKRFRRISVGPHVTVFFENFDTMWMQVQEMLYIEKGGDEQIEDELAAYNPMIPDGAELTCTLMFEIDDELTRRQVLGHLGGVENFISIKVGTHQISAVPEKDVERTSASGKASSVQFLHFPFTPEQIAAFRDTAQQVTFQIEHENYGHIAIISDRVRSELATDFS
jgi:Protein of unknown function (DUF3501)